MRDRLRCLWALSVLAPLGATGCAPADPGAEPTTQTASPISGGAPAPDEIATVAIANGGDQGSGLCSGSLIAPNLVVTARSCLSDADLGDCASANFNGTTDAADVGVTNDAALDFAQPPPAPNVLEVVVEQAQSPACGNDLALLILAEGALPGVTPYVPRVDERPVDGELYAALGYGGITDNPGDDLGVRRRRDDLVIACVGVGCELEGLLASMYIKPSEFLGEVGVCVGDGGGPALDAVGRVIGVSSRGEHGCANPLYSELEAHGDWIRQTAIHAAELGGYEPAPWAQGAPTDPTYCEEPLLPCDEGSTCEDEVCVPVLPTDPPPDDGAPPPPPPAEAGPEEDGGCAMQAPSSHTGHAWLLLGLTLAALRRSRSKPVARTGHRHLASTAPPATSRITPVTHPAALRRANLA